MSANATHSNEHHTHGAGAHLEPDAARILKTGVEELVALSQGLQFQPLVSERYPNPLALAVYGEIPDPALVRQDALKQIGTERSSKLICILKEICRNGSCTQP